MLNEFHPGAKVLREKHDLADVIRVVHQLAIDRLHDRVLLTANQYRLLEIFRLATVRAHQRRIASHVPSMRARRLWWCCDSITNSIVAIAIRFLAVGSQKVGPAREHVAGHVFHDHGDAV